MVFSSLNYLFLFLPAVLLAYYLIPRRFRNAKNGILLIFSLLFYLYGEPIGIFVMLASIAANYTAARLMNGRSVCARKWLLAAGVVVNVGLLCYYKYLAFAVETADRFLGFELPVPEIVMPIGISFFTFQGMSYLIDVYRGRCPAQKSLLRVATYISLFPQLVAGPIVRYETIADELERRNETVADFAAGARRFTVGLGKKMLLANPLGLLAQETFGAAAGTLGALPAWLGAVGYALHIYYDFSGYSDMAIGLGRMFGFHFCENFDHPYLARSVTDFWRRWHMSLSGWFRDYVYIPLGGNRRGTARQALNLMLVWLLTGLWHGASWNFVAWGLYYGLLLVLEKLVLAKVFDRLPGFVGRVFALAAVLIGWVIFNCTGMTAVGQYLSAMFTGASASGGPGMTYLLGQYRVELAVGVIFCLPIPSGLRTFTERRSWAYCVRDCLLVAVFALSVVAIVNSSFNPFIYFRF